MANELKITDIVDEKALKEVSSLNTRLNNLRTTYKELAIEMGGQIRVNVSDFAGLTTKADNYKASLLSLKKTIEEMNTVQSLQEKALKSISDKMNALGKDGTIVQAFNNLTKGIENLIAVMEKLANKTLTVQQVTKTITKTVTSTGSNARKLSEELENMSSDVVETAKYLLELQERLNGVSAVMAQTTNSFEQGEMGVDEYTERMDSLKAEYEQLSSDSEMYRRVMTKLNTEMLKSSGSYKEVNAAMIKLRRMYKELSAEVRESPLGQDIGKTINSLNDELKRIDAGMGNYQRNVGNYASAFNGLGYQVTQVVRELPALNSGFNTFMIAIGNNLPMLVDEIDRARKLNAQMAADGNKTVPVWKQVTGAIFNWQTALVVGLTLITMYWKDISNFFQELFTGAKGYEAAAEAQKKYNEAMREGAKNAAREVTEVEILYKASQDQNRSLEERKKAIDKLQKDFPKYFGNMSQEEILAGKAASAYDKLRDSIIKQAQARAIQDKLAELNKSVLEDQIKLADAQKRMEENKAKSDQVRRITRVNEVTGDITTGYEVDDSIADPKLRRELLLAAQAYDNAAAGANTYQKAIDEIKPTQELLIGMIDVTKLFPEEKEIEEQGNTTKEKERDILEELLQTRIDLIEENRARELAQNEKDFQEKMEGLDKESELYKNYEELMRREALAINEKYDEEERKAREEALKRLQEDAEREVEILGNKYAMRALTATKGLNDEFARLSEEYSKGLIDAEEYEEKRAKLTNDYAIESAKLGIEMVKKQLETENLSAEKRMELTQALADAEIALQDAVIASNEEQARAREEAFAKAREGFEALRDIADESVEGMGDLMDGLYSIFEAIEKGGKDTFAGVLAGAIQMVSGIKEMVSGMYDSQIEELEKEEETNEEAKEKEMERIEELANHGAISEEEAEARKRAAEDKTAAKNAEVQKKKAELQTKQAKFEKAMNISQTIMATSLAVVKALPNLVLAALVGAMGAVQLATIIAQPIPKYAKGTKDHKGGLAIVGDGGKHEGVITDRGMWITPDKPTLVDLPVHAMVIPDITKYTTAKGLKSDLLNKPRNGNGEPVIVNVNNDYKRLEQEMMGNRGELKKLTKVVKKMSRASELRGIYGRL